jgi:uncharacterized protein YbjT (DUF2867 family)
VVVDTAVIIPKMRILVTGASGFVGAALAPRLLAEGYELRALIRDPARARAALAGQVREVGAIEVVQGDVLTGAGLERALDEIEVAYYLIHSMESPSSRATDRGSASGVGSGRPSAGSAPSGGRDSPFSERERLAAENFAAQARRAGVRRIVYLGGLLPHGRRASPHLSSRAQVERILLESVPGSVALRASIVIGARSRSFRLLVRLVERLPVLALPAWRRFRTQPIDVRDVTEMLLAAASVGEVAGRSLDIGGPQALTYGEIVERIAELMLLHRPMLALRASMTPLTGRLTAALAGEDPELIVALMESLECDLLVADDHAAELLGVRLHSFDAAVEHALREWEAVEPLAAR